MFCFNLFGNMKTSMILKIAVPTFTISFVMSYFMKVAFPYWDQYLGLALVILLDGFFGVVAGVKREGFKTFKALKIFKSLFTWFLILTTALVTEKAFPYASWISETFILPVIVFYLISAIKNASSSGFIRSEVVNKIMEKIDQHKN